MKHLLLTAAIIALIPIAACTTTSSTPAVVDMSFAQVAPLQLNVGAVQVLDQTLGQSARYIERNVNPSSALARFAKQRLQAVGGEGTLSFVIQQASLSSAESMGTGHWSEAFELSKPMEYTITMRVGLGLVGRTSQPNVKSAYTLERKKILPAGTSIVERDRELNMLVLDMVQSMDAAVEKGLSENMRLIVRPGPITFGKPQALD